MFNSQKTGNPNPILVWFREVNKIGVKAEDVDFNYAEHDGQDIKHIIHARKVLSRLANIEEESK